MSAAMPGRALPIVQHLRLEGSPLQREAADRIVQLYEALEALVKQGCDGAKIGQAYFDDAEAALKRVRGEQ